MTKKFIKKMVRLSGVELSRYDKALDDYGKLYAKYRDYTMIPESLFVTNLDLASRFLGVDGSIVECGVWRGGMIAAIAEIADPSKKLHLFDSFEGLPPAKAVDGKEALAWQSDTKAPEYRNNCATEASYAIDAMKLAGNSNYQIYQGWFNETLSQYNGGPISLLRLDCDWYDSVKECLDTFFPLLSNNGVVMIDDYYAWDGCAKAVHDYLSQHSLPCRVYQWRDQLAYIVKKG